MARIRTIKPEFWRHEDLSDLAPETHMLAAALLNHADDEGYFNANPRLVQSQCVPLRDDSTSIRRSLDDLSSVGFIRLFEGVDGKQYGHIVKFLDHQRIDRPKGSKIKDLEDSTKDRRGIDEESTPEGKGTGKGKEQGTGNGEGESADPPGAEHPVAAKPEKWTEEDRQLAQSMLDEIRKISPSTKGSKRWPDDVRLMRERDHRSLAEIWDLFTWANQDSFWGANILSPGKLREKWPQLEAQRNRPQRKLHAVGPGGLKPAVDNSDVARSWAAKHGGAA